MPDKGEIDTERANEILAEIKDTEIGIFASLDQREVQEFIALLPDLSEEEIQLAFSKIAETININSTKSSKLFNEEGFLSVDSDFFEFLNSDSTKSY